MNMDTFLAQNLVTRTNTSSLKWDKLGERYGDPDLLPMWVADMEFAPPQAVLEAMTKRVAHGAFGYSFVPDSYYEAFAAWQLRHHNAELKREWVRFSTGVVTGFYWMVNAFTEPSDAVLIVSPVYYPFFNAVRDTGRTLVRSEAVRGSDGVYRLDEVDFERKIVANNVKLYIMCSPHNPIGRVWSSEELETQLRICQRHGVIVVADEIHQDLVIGSQPFVSAQEVAQGAYRSSIVTLNALSKTFNLAGLLHSHIVIPDERLRARYDAYAKTVNQTETNILATVAYEAAWRNGDEWLEAMLGVVRHNRDHIVGSLAKYAPKIHIPPLEGTYLLWLDLREYVTPVNTKEFIQDTCKLAIDYGEWFSDQAQGFVRINLATDPAFIAQATDRIISNLPKVTQ